MEILKTKNNACSIEPEERETHTHTHTQTEGQKETETERQRQRERDRQKEKGRVVNQCYPPATLSQGLTLHEAL